MSARSGVSDAHADLTEEFLEINSLCAYGQSPGRGVGVFALTSIPADQVVLRDLVRTIPGDEREHVMESSMRSHLFIDREQKKRNIARPDFHMVFGASSILNHSERANCGIRWTTIRGFPVVETFTLREISAGEELFYKYEDLDDYTPKAFV